MGRSGRQRGNFAKSLISGGDNFSIKKEAPSYQVIHSPLKEIITSALRRAQTREALYLEISTPLKEISPDLLTKDPTFEKILSWEVDKIKVEGQRDIYNYHFSNLKEMFLEDLFQNDFAHLGRSLISNEHVPRLLKNDLKTNYLEELKSLRGDQDEYFQFIFDSYLPLTEPDGYLKSELLGDLSREVTNNLVQDSVLAQAFPEFLHGNVFRERSDISFLLYQQLVENPGQIKTEKDLIEQVMVAQSEVIVEHIFSKLSKEKGQLNSEVTIENIGNFVLNDQEKIHYLNQAIKKSKPGYKEILKKTYTYFGGDEKDWQGYIASFKETRTLSGADIFYFFHQIAEAGATASLNKQDYSYERDFKFMLTPIISTQ